MRRLDPGNPNFPSSRKRTPFALPIPPERKPETSSGPLVPPAVALLVVRLEAEPPSASK